MIINGFNSDDYRYFKMTNDLENLSIFGECIKGIKTGEIIKIENDLLQEYLIGIKYSRYLQQIEPYNYKIKKYPKDKPFNIVEFLKIQNPITPSTYGLNFYLQKNQLFYINKWLKEKLEDPIPMGTLSIAYHCRYTTFAELNYAHQEFIKDCELNITNFPFLLNDCNHAENVEENNNSNNILSQTTTNKNITNNASLNKHSNRMYLLSGTMEFWIHFKPEEKLYFNNPAVAILFSNQDLIKLLYNSVEVLGEEKEELFKEEYKDNIPNTNIKYYKLKDGINLPPETIRYSLHLEKTLPYLKHLDINFPKNTGFDSEWYAGFNYYSSSDLRNDGYLKYFYINYGNNIRSNKTEKEVLKFAERLNEKEAKQHYDILKTDESNYTKKINAEIYINEHKKRYMKEKRKNHNITPILFMDSEIQREKKYQATKLAKVLSEIKPGSK